MESASFDWQQLGEPYLLSFFGWWQLVSCAFAFVALMAIWWHIGRQSRDLGQVWLALSVLCWSISGAIEVYYAQQLMEAQQQLFGRLSTEQSAMALAEAMQNHPSISTLPGLSAGRSMLSLFNSLFILLALPWFRYLPPRISPLIKSKYWFYIVGLPFVLYLLPTLSKLVSGRSYGLISELDYYYALLTLAFLGYVLWESFRKRRLPLLAWLSVFCVLLTLVAQYYKLTDSFFGQTLLAAIFKTSLIMIFFALALSWVKELAETVAPASEQLRLHLARHKDQQGKLINEVQLRGWPGQPEYRIALSRALFELLYTFVHRKLNDGEGWLEIKPKQAPRSGKQYDIRDHNQIKRLLHALLDGIYGSENWTADQQQSLKQNLFEMSEKRERKIRIRLSADQLSIASELQF